MPYKGIFLPLDNSLCFQNWSTFLYTNTANFFSRSTRFSYSANNISKLDLSGITFLKEKCSFSKPVNFFFIQFQGSSGVDTDASATNTQAFDRSLTLVQAIKKFSISSHDETSSEKLLINSLQELYKIGRHALTEKYTGRRTKNDRTQY